MDFDQAVFRMEAHQRAVLDQLDRAAALLLLPPEAAREPLAHARWQLVRMLQEYQVFKHWRIFDPAIRRGTPGQVAAATRLKAGCIAAGEAYRDHVRIWSATDVAARWDAYRVATRTMIKRLRAHLAVERRAVVDLCAAGPARRLAG